jgi:hypothetical protein
VERSLRRASVGLDVVRGREAGVLVNDMRLGWREGSEEASRRGDLLLPSFGERVETAEGPTEGERGALVDS